MVLFKGEEAAGEGSDDAVQTGSVKGQHGKYPGNKGKKLELNLASSQVRWQCCQSDTKGLWGHGAAKKVYWVDLRSHVII